MLSKGHDLRSEKLLAVFHLTQVGRCYVEAIE